MSRLLMLPLLLLTALLPAQVELPQTIDLRVENQPLLVLLERVARQLERGLVVEGEVIEKVQVEARIFAKDAPWDDAVRLLREEYGVVMQVGVKRIVVADADADFRRSLVRRYYPTDLVTHPRQDRAGPRMGTTWWYDRSGDGGSILDLEDEAPLLFDDLHEIMRNYIGPPEIWDRDGVVLQEESGLLLVNNVPDQQGRVKELLEELEKSSSRQVVCRLYDFDATDAHSFTAEEWPAARGDRMPVVTFVTRDGVMNHHWQGQQRMMTVDVETVGTVEDPVRDAVRTGLVLEVKPHVTRNGILANIMLSQARLAGAEPSDIQSVSGLLLGSIDLLKVAGQSCSDQRFIENGGATVYRLGDSFYVVSLEVVSTP